MSHGDDRGLARPRKFHLEHITDFGFGAIRHHDDAVGEKERLIDIMRDHERGLLVLAPEFDEHLLQFIAREGIQHAERFIKQQHLRSQRESPRNAHTLPHPL